MTTSRIESILSDPNASDWLKDALRAALQLDPVDASYDARELADILNEHMNDVWREKIERVRRAQNDVLRSAHMLCIG